MTSDITVKGIVLACFPQGEYGKRIVLLSDALGKITVFASGAAKQTSKIIGSVRPMTAAEFTLGEGRGAKSIHGISVIESFSDIASDPEAVFYGMYFLELADYFGTEGMAADDARKMLNLMFVAFTALKDKRLPLPLIRKIFELRMLVQEGLYTEEPSVKDDTSFRLWRHAVTSSLTKLFDPASSMASPEESEAFSESVSFLLRSEVPAKFKSAALL